MVADAQEWSERYPAMRNFPTAPAVNLPVLDEFGEVAVVRDAKGAEHRLALASVSEARLAFHWNTSKE